MCAPFPGEGMSQANAPVEYEGRDIAATEESDTDESSEDGVDWEELRLLLARERPF